MKVRLSACGALFWRSNQLIWDDYLGHAQFALADGTERLLRWFSDWRELQSARECASDPIVGERYEKAALLFLHSHILVEFDSPRHRQEEAVYKAWEPWGALASAFHFSTRTKSDTPYLSSADESVMLWDKIPSQPPPPAIRIDPHSDRIALPQWTEACWQSRDLIDVLYERRSRRTFGDAPVPLNSAAAILQIGGGMIDIQETTQTVFKTSPSAGGRHPTEMYVHAGNVAGVAPGVYHYDAQGHALERVGDQQDKAALVAACGDQEWVADASLIIFYTSVFARNQWKYGFSRAYRVLHYDVGHMNQTIHLLATALGLRMTYTSALRDELVEGLLGIGEKFSDELVMGCAVIGT